MNKYMQSKGDRKAMLEEAAVAGRSLLEVLGLNAGNVAEMFAAITPAQRQAIMENYLKNGRVR